jgi:hypothetical protein
MMRPDQQRHRGLTTGDARIWVLYMSDIQTRMDAVRCLQRDAILIIVESRPCRGRRVWR